MKRLRFTATATLTAFVSQNADFPGDQTQDDLGDWMADILLAVYPANFTEIVVPSPAGDMEMADYDDNEDGVVNASQRLDGLTIAQVRAHTPQTHTHTESQITDLVHTPVAHTHTESQITDLVHTPVAHTHTESQITDLVHTPVAHTHTESQITDLVHTPDPHTHTEAEITDLAHTPDPHTHSEAEITDLAHTPDPHTHSEADITDLAHISLASIGETNTGTEATKAVTPDSLAGSVLGEKGVCIVPHESDADVVVADGKVAFTVPLSMNGMNLVDVLASVHTQGVTNTTDIQIRRRRAGSDVDMLSTKITIAAEYFASDEVINTGNDDVATGDQLYVDVDAVHSGTAPKGLSVVLTFRKV